MSLSLSLRVEGETSAADVEIAGKQCMGDLALKAASACGLSKGMFVLVHEEEILRDMTLPISGHCFSDGDEVVVRVDKAARAAAHLREMGLFPTFNEFMRVLGVTGGGAPCNTSVLSLFAESNPALLETYENGETVLHKCLHRHVRLVASLIGLGADVNADRCVDKSTSLHIAVKHNKAELVKVLLSNGADVRLCDNKLRAPLHYAPSYEIAKLLVDAGAVIDAKDYSGRTALLSTIEEDVVEYLLSQGADPTVRAFEL
eukprot:TRINITY_DN7552_c0_g2_i1.p1 TRINITY_DN7552_c0_g2~~TRINITY_DN7552_c0_g2_i1.p1  ORF type:complete len:259 (+),score=42.35 TRINITY_DN7552_c0_g2_i1:57-833(+)